MLCIHKIFYHYKYMFIFQEEGFNNMWISVWITVDK